MSAPSNVDPLPSSGPRTAPPWSRHPVVFTVLIAPFGAVWGFVSVALAFLATKRGLTVEQGAELLAIGTLPQVWKFIWAPLGDTTLDRHRWYLGSLVLCAAGTFATAAVPLGPSTFRLIEGIVLLSSIACTFLGFSVEGMIAHLTRPADRGRVCGWYQAGNIGGNGLGGGLGLWLLTTLTAGWETGLILAALVLACAAALPFVPRIPADFRGESPVAMARHTVVELWTVIRSRDGALAALLCILPIGTGAASGVMCQAAVADHWGVGAATVGLIQGSLGGLVGMAGCIAGGYGCARLGARTGYALYGVIMALVALAMFLLPATPAVYVAGNLGYAFAIGLCFAAFTAFVLDAIGSRLAATKYNGFASLMNTPISYMGYFLAVVETRTGPRGMLRTESACGFLSIVIVVLVARAWRAPIVQPAG